MKQYFKAVQVADEEQVTITSMHFVGGTKLWWRTRLDDDSSARRPKIKMWELLKKKLKDHFLPLNMAWVAREALKSSSVFPS